VPPSHEVRVRRTLVLLLRFMPVLTLLTLPPAMVGAVDADWSLVWPLLPFGVLTALLSLPGLRRKPAETATTAENAVAVALVFPLALLVSSGPHLTHGLSLLDAAFEGMSGVTATGLTRYGNIETQSFALKFLRAWQQWIGGYVIVTLTVALLPRGARKAQEMAESDVADDAGDEGQDQPDLRIRARQVSYVYIALTLICIGLTSAAGVSVENALLHGLTSVSTAGFSPLNDSLESLPQLGTVCLMGFALLGAIALSDYLRPLLSGEGLRKLLAVAGALLALSAAAGGLMYWMQVRASAPVTLFDAMQVAMSAQTTTGFSTLSVPELEASSKAVLAVIMYIGGDVGSTAGGIKLARFVTLALFVYALLGHRMSRQTPPGGDAGTVLRLIGFWIGLSVIGCAGLIAVGHAPLDAIFEWSSSLNNVGLTSGLSSGDMPVATRLILTFCMWMGRVEILAVLLLFRPATWRV